MSAFDDFYTSHQGKAWDKHGQEAAGLQTVEPFGGQCVSLIKTYLIYLYGQDMVADSYGNAIDYWVNRSTSGILALCTPVQEPQDGDIGVSSGADPTFGHIFIYRDGQAFAQNVSSDPRALLWPLRYQGQIYGYLRPKVLSEESAALPEGQKVLDLSDANGSIDFDALKDQVSGVILRASFGTNKDRMIDQNLANLKASGLPLLGLYCFDYALDDEQAKSEADFICDLAKDIDPKPVIFFDCEYDSERWAKQNGKPLTADSVQRHTRIFMDTVKSHGFQTGFYANRDWMDTRYAGFKKQPDELFWYARPGHTPDLPFDVLQYGTSTAIPGTSGEVDLNIWNAIVKKEIKVEDYGSLYRLYNPSNGDHLYTIDHDEAQKAQQSGWKYEGIAWKSPRTGDPVYRILSPDGKHVFTSDPNEKKGLEGMGYKTEGIAFRTSGSSPVWRLYNPNSGAHILSADRTEHDGLVKAGWVCEGQPLRY